MVLKTAGRVGRILLGLALVPLIAWSAAAIWFDGPPQRWLAGLLAGGLALVAGGALAFLRPVRRALIVVLVAFLAVLGWWLNIPASNEGDWQPDVAQPGERQHRRQHRHHPQRAQLRLPQRDRLHAALGDAQLRPLAAARRGPVPLVLGPAGDRAHHHELGIRRRPAPRDLDRDAQGGGRVVLGGARLLPPVRALLRGRRRARPDRGAHELSRRGRLSSIG